MNNLCGNDFLTGPFDDCLRCQFLGNGCSGPRTTCMSHERYVEWLKALKKMRDFTNQDIVDSTGLSKATVDDIFAGRRKDISRATAGLLEDFLIGAGKWPCAMRLAKGKEVVYEDRPETLEELRARAEQIERLRQNYDNLRNSVDTEMARVRTEYEDDIKFYKGTIDLLKDQVARKDRYIDILIETASKGGDLKLLHKDYNPSAPETQL